MNVLGNGSPDVASEKRGIKVPPQEKVRKNLVASIP